MTKNHLKRIAAPSTWHISRKNPTWITRPNSGAHSLAHSTSLNVVLRDLLKISATTREVKFLLNNKNVLVDGRRITEHEYCVGLMDVVSLPDTDQHFRIILNRNSKLSAIKITKEETSLKICKIINITKLKGKTQINLIDGRNILTDKTDYKTKDSLLIELPSQKVVGHFKFHKGAPIYLYGGKHAGFTGEIEDIKEDLHVKIGNETIKTAIKYAFVIGSEKPAIKLGD